MTTPDTVTETAKNAVPTLVEDFIKAGLYLRNWSQQTAVTYRRMLEDAPAKLTKETLEKWVMAHPTSSVRKSQSTRKSD